MKTEEHEAEEEEILYPGVVLDAENRIVLVAVDYGKVMVNVRRFQHWPSIADLITALKEHRWIQVDKSSDDLAIYAPRDSKAFDVPIGGLILRTAEENESAQIAIQLGLAAWPSWGECYRDRYRPLTMMKLVGQPVYA